MKSYEMLQNLPLIHGAESSLLIVDSLLLKRKKTKKWSSQFLACYSVSAGEDLKQLEAIPDHIGKILKLQEKGNVPFSKIIILGGGSVGDFGGFIGSVLRRGIPVVQIPSTWLAALDSAHGGKTALNAGGFKNQIGTIHYPQRILIIKEILESQPKHLLRDAAGEFLKTALLGGPLLVEKMAHWDWVNGKIKWSDLKKFIDVKYSVLKKDPYEKKGLRHVLNLGHTLGHVWEAYHGITHGEAVYYGLLFDLAWSTQKGYLLSRTAQKIMSLEPWENLFDIEKDRNLFQMTESKLIQYLLHDKKNQKKGLRYIFIKKPGRVLIKQISVKEIVKEYRRQKKILEEFYEDL